MVALSDNNAMDINRNRKRVYETACTVRGRPGSFPADGLISSLFFMGV